MISPIHIISVALGIGFSLGIIGKLGKKVSIAFMLLGLAFMTFISYQWAFAHLFGNSPDAIIYTAGFKPPYSINLQMGRIEAILTALVNTVGLLGGIYLIRMFKERGTNAMIIFLILIMGIDAMIMTRDLFNLFVFIEVESIALAGLILIAKNVKSISAGFKYVIAGGIISAMFLLGVVFVYAFTGTLNLDGAIASNLSIIKGSAVVVFLVLIALILELKPFPANGWALDAYQASNPGIGAIMSAATATSSLFVLYKVLPLGGETWYAIVAGIGIVTFVASNFLGIKQTNANRLLGYSSIGQIGLLMTIIGLSNKLGDKFMFIAFGILISHYLAKAGLFWLSGIIKKENIKDWSVLRKKPLLLFLFGTFIFALSGFPPFPSFFGKWELVMQLANNGQYIWIVAILIGSLLEIVYLLRWFGYASKLSHSEIPNFKIPIEKIIPVIIFAIAAYVVGVFSYIHIETFETINYIKYIPIALVVVLFLIDFLPAVIKNILIIGVFGYLGYAILPDLYEANLMKFIFATIFIVGGILTLIPGFTKKGKRTGFYPTVALMFAGLIGIIQAETTLQFFLSWEFLTIGSYLLILRGKKALKPALSYILFSIGGAYAILVGFAISQVGADTLSLEILSNIGQFASVAYILLAIGFMSKIAVLGLHIWLPGSYTEAEDDATPMLSAVLINAGVFGLLMLMLSINTATIGNIDVAYLLGWLGVITAITGNLLAVFQEDAKKLIAYSSIGAMGFILFTFAMMSHLGWMTAITYTLNHFLYKALLFIAIAGVIHRVKTRKMYKMGGLIKRMPFSFLAVMIGIITLAGMPPLSGFAGKWLIYNAIILKGWYLQGAFILFSGIVAFLYCFRLIFTVFLGQLKDEHRNVKEAPIWFIIPQIVLILGIMVLSMFPHLVLQPIGDYLAEFFPKDALTWDGTYARTTLGYWSGNTIMYIVMALFAILFLWLIIFNAKAKKIGQFDIGYSGERPERPETTHQAHNMFAAYNKALGWLTGPYTTKFWDGIDKIFHGIAGQTRKLYTGNGQTYILHIILFMIAIFFIAIA